MDLLTYLPLLVFSHLTKFLYTVLGVVQISMRLYFCLNSTLWRRIVPDCSVQNVHIGQIEILFLRELIGGLKFNANLNSSARPLPTRWVSSCSLVYQSFSQLKPFSIQHLAYLHIRGGGWGGGA